MNRRRAVFVGFALCLLCVVSCASRPSHDEPRHYGPKVNIRDFLQNTATYKGRIITLLLKVDEAFDWGQSKSLRDYVGKEVKFTTATPQGKRLSVVIKIPEGVSIPEVTPLEEVSITFSCTLGLLQQGNEAKIIEKPKPGLKG